MNPKVYADIARAYFTYKKVYRYHLKKIMEMDNQEVIDKCHMWYEEHDLAEEYSAFEKAYLEQHT